MLFKELGLNLQSDSTGSDLFGAAVALNEIGDLLAVGAPSNQSGSVYLYRRNHDGSRTQIQKITPSDSPAGAKFGSSVSLSGGVLAIGAPFTTGVSSRTNHGAVYVYFWNGSSFANEQKIIPTGGATPSTNSLNNTYFGYSVSLSTDGNYLAVGNDASNEEGCLVYTYYKMGTSFSLASVLANPRTGAYLSKFGKSVCLDGSGTTLVCGSPLLASSDNIAVKPGGAFTFVRRTSSFSLMDSIYFASSGFPFVEFGSSVATNFRGTKFTFGSPGYSNQKGLVAVLVASAPSFSMNLSQPVVFQNHGFLIEPPVSDNTRFGSCLSFDSSGARLLVGMDGSADTIGKSWVFEIFPDLTYKSFSLGKVSEQVFEWSPPSITQPNQKFGQSVALSKDGLVSLIGAPSYNTNGSVLSYKSRLRSYLVIQDIAHNFYSEFEVDTGIDINNYNTSFDAIPPVSKVAQRMFSTVSYPNRIDFVFEKLGSPTGNIGMQLIFGDMDGPYTDPKAVLATASNFSVSSVSSVGTYSINLPARLIQENDHIWIVLSFDSNYTSSADLSNFIRMHGTNSSPFEFQSYSGSWSPVPSFSLCYKPVSSYAVGRSEYGYLSVPPVDIRNSLVTAKGAPFSVNGGEKLILNKNGFFKQTLYLPTPLVPSQLSQAELVSFLNNNLDERFDCTAEAATIDGKDVVILRNNDVFTNYYGAVEGKGFIRADSEWDISTNGTNPSDNALSFTNQANIWLFKPGRMADLGINKNAMYSDWHDWHENIHKPLQSFYFSNSDIGGPQIYFRPKVFIFPLSEVNWSLRELYDFVINNFVMSPSVKKVLDMNGNYAPADLSAVVDQCHVNIVLLFQYDTANDQQYLGAYWYR